MGNRLGARPPRRPQRAPAATWPRCTSCGRPIWWAATRGGRLMLVDPQASPTGNLARIGQLDKAGRIVVEVVLAGRPHRDPLRWVAHFATCPHATNHRRARR